VVLADTSIWIDHLRSGERALARLLESREVMSHPFVVGEVALGHLRERERVLAEIRDLPEARVAADSEVLHLIDERALYGRGIGYVDAHLLASLRLTPGARLWTADRRLSMIAEQLGLAMPRGR
jgi:predicted nucleic acid-binding protein